MYSHIFLISFKMNAKISPTIRSTLSIIEEIIFFCVCLLLSASTLAFAYGIELLVKSITSVPLIGSADKVGSKSVREDVFREVLLLLEVVSVNEVSVAGKVGDAVSENPFSASVRTEMSREIFESQYYRIVGSFRVVLSSGRTVMRRSKSRRLRERLCEILAIFETSMI